MHPARQFLWFLFFCMVNSAFCNAAPLASFLDLTDNQSPPIAFKTFPLSTEIEIGKIQAFTQDAPKGIYVTVGGERGFRSGALANNTITHLFLLDLADDVIHYNRINAELLKTPKREDYLKLRWDAPYEEWKAHTPLNTPVTQEDFNWWVQNIRDLDNMPYPLPEALNKLGYLPQAKNFIEMRDKLFILYKATYAKNRTLEEFSKFLEKVTYLKAQKIIRVNHLKVSISEDEWQGWAKTSKNKQLNCSKLWLAHPDQALNLGEILDYKKGNYLFSDELYRKLHDLATQNKITVVKINLSDPKQVAKFITRLKEIHYPLSVLDLDNLHHPAYLSDKDFKSLLKALLPLGQKQSTLITMGLYKDYACAEYQAYLAFTFANVRSWPPTFSLTDFFASWSWDVLALMNGRLYEKEGDIPPINTLTD